MSKTLPLPLRLIPVRPLLVQERAFLPKHSPSRDVHSASTEEVISTGQIESIPDFVLLVMFFPGEDGVGEFLILFEQ